MSEREIALVMEVLRAHHPNQGEVTKMFEKAICNLIGCGHAIATTSGTVSIFLSLKGLGIGAGDEVIVPDITFIATANAVTLSGATPVIVDVDPKTLTASPASIKGAITSKTKAIVPVHVSGRSTDMDEVMKIAKEHDLKVVEDAAEALLSKRNGRYLGTVGNAGCFSLSSMKVITSGQGGIIVTDDDAFALRLRELRAQGIATGSVSGGDDRHESIGFNFKYTDLQAAVALGQLEALSDRAERARATNRLYREQLASVPQISLLPFDLDNGELPLWTDAIAERRNELDAFLRARGIDCRRFWHPIHKEAPYAQSDDEFPNSTILSYKAIWLPSAFTMTDQDVTIVSESIKEFYAKPISV
jgi:dTDP-4-amino-4,6-dideoxygalactose transaminase